MVEVISMNYHGYRELPQTYIIGQSKSLSQYIPQMKFRVYKHSLNNIAVVAQAAVPELQLRANIKFMKAQIKMKITTSYVIVIMMKKDG
jgi:hypothetical protein